VVDFAEKERFSTKGNCTTLAADAALPTPKSPNEHECNFSLRTAAEFKYKKVLPVSRTSAGLLFDAAGAFGKRTAASTSEHPSIQQAYQVAHYAAATT
jgi:hypothetical protein